MKKETMLIVASLLFVLGLLLCTGVDQNPWQAVIALPMMGGASWLFNRVDAMERKAQSGSRFKVQGSGLGEAA